MLAKIFPIPALPVVHFAYGKYDYEDLNVSRTKQRFLAPNQLLFKFPPMK